MRYFISSVALMALATTVVLAKPIKPVDKTCDITRCQDKPRNDRHVPVDPGCMTSLREKPRMPNPKCFDVACVHPGKGDTYTVDNQGCIL